MSFRDLIGTIAPPWLNRQWGERFLYALGLHVDAIAEAAREGVRARAPGADQTPPDALVQIGRDRLISRGKYESNEGYADRLSGSFDAWSRAASLEGLTRSLQGLLRDADTKAKAITWAGLWATIPGWDEPIEYVFGSQIAWHWGWTPTIPGYWDWGQVFVFLYPSVSGQWEPSTLGDGLILGDGTWCLGVREPSEVVQAARLVVDQWRSATTRVRVIVSFDSTWPSSPYSPAGFTQQATETWAINHTVVGGVAVPSRYLSAAYLDPVG